MLTQHNQEKFHYSKQDGLLKLVLIGLAEHRCNKAGCGEVFILDGNMKNSREVCFATDAGHTEFSGLAGMIQTGCPNTPAYKSRYCLIF